jgi:hypothetical protein
LDGNHVEWTPGSRAVLAGLDNTAELEQNIWSLEPDSHQNAEYLSRMVPQEDPESISYPKYSRTGVGPPKVLILAVGSYNMFRFLGPYKLRRERGENIS